MHGAGGGTATLGFITIIIYIRARDTVKYDIRTAAQPSTLSLPDLQVHGTWQLRRVLEVVLSGAGFHGMPRQD